MMRLSGGRVDEKMIRERDKCRAEIKSEPLKGGRRMGRQERAHSGTEASKDSCRRNMRGRESY